ncbi:MAG: glycine cleavage system protein GcvH [Methanobacteriota archaeon]|nr:MAG: glycine cleavage system protein GcvH [Euryarchaeota archaeon]
MPKREFDVPPDLYYTKEHEWLRREGEEAVVGITDYAQDQLQDVVYVELPEVGTRFAKGEQFASVESVKAVSDVYMPVSGEIVEVNQRLGEDPGLINDEPYGGGWLVRIRITDLGELQDLLSSEEYLEYLEREVEH